MSQGFASNVSTLGAGVVADVPVLNEQETTREIIEVSKCVPVNMHNGYYNTANVDHFWIQWRFEAIKRLLGDTDLGNQILEVGSGNGVAQGQFEKWLDKPVHGCDLNYGALRMTPPMRGNVYLYNVLDCCPEWKSWYNSILLLDVLEHIDNSIEFLKALRHHLSAEGRLIINVPAMPWLYSRYDSVGGHVQRYTMGQLQGELSLAGFEVEKQCYWGANLVPVAAVRKLMVMFMTDEQAMSNGFNPPSEAAERFLRGLMRLELKGWRLPECGTSLCVVAKRRESVEEVKTAYQQGVR
jgi:hypothetical protein